MNALPSTHLRKLLVLPLLLLCGFSARAADLPDGFAERQVASGLTGATAMAFAPDGRLFVCQQGGQLRVVKNGVLLAEPFLTVNADATGERGLLGVAFDPGFASNGFVYVYYTANVAPRHNRVSRFTADGDRAAAGSEIVIFRLDDLSGATVHNGGAMHFGPDGKLYVAVGENAAPQNSQTLENLFGKMLRINADGSIPSDNPFFDTATGNRRAIWALGLRNPFTFDFRPTTGRMFINDVGEHEWEEINDGVAGSNYGWPQSEGPTTNPAHRAPLHAYAHGAGLDTGCAITGGAFYDPAQAQFPPSFAGKYFFADFCSGWIRVLDPSDNTTEGFASGLALPVDLKVGPDGSLYYLARGNDALYQIIYTGTGAPLITSHPASRVVSVGQQATFSVAASGGQPLAYQWQRNGVNIGGANSTTLVLPSVTLSDSGAQFRAVVSNSFGGVTSDAATLTVTTNSPPVATITSPAEGSLYSAGETINYAGEGQDTEDGTLQPGAFTWQVDFHHDIHSHPFLPPSSGSNSGSFVVPTVGEKSADVWYRIRLKVMDSGGLTHETFRDVLPRRAQVTLATEPAGLQVSLDGRPWAAPVSFVGVVGIVRSVSTETRQSLNGVVYEFQRWTDGGSASHDISTPASDATVTAVFAPSQNPAPGSVQFGAGVYQASEGDGHVEVTVTRSGDLSAPVSVDYATADATATERSDYLPALGTLRFAPDESSKIIRVLLTGGAVVENTETFNISLSNVTGPSALGTPSVATLTVFDDDTAPPASNPIDDAETFVRQHYQDFLNREPDEAGLRFWAEQITACGTDRQCLDLKRQHVSAAFFLSIEFQETGFLVYRMTAASFGRFPRFRGFLRDTQALGRGVVVGVDDWQQRLETNKRDFINEFVARPEFLSEFPQNLTPSEFVDKLDTHTGFSLSQAERDALIAALSAGTLDRAGVLRAVAEDGDFVLRESNRAFVLLQYFGYLRRNPEDADFRGETDPDLLGYNFWLNKLNQFNGNFQTAQMVLAFISSIEYRQRFGP